MNKLFRLVKKPSLLLLLIILCYFLVYFKPFTKNFPLPSLGTNKFFNLTFSDYNFFSQELKKGRFPYWNPYVGGGMMPIGQPQHTLFNPFHLLILKFTWFPLNLKLLYGLGISTCAFGTLLYLKLLKTKPFLSVLGALFFTFSGHLVSQISDFPLFQSLCFLPWVFAVIHCLATKPNLKNSALLGSVLGLQILSGPIGVPFVSLVFGFLYYLFIGYNSKRKIIEFVSPIVYFLLAVFLFLGLSSIKLFILNDLSFFETHSLKYYFSFSPYLKDLVTLFNPLTNNNFSLYTGLTPFVLFGLVIAWGGKSLNKVKLQIIFLTFLTFTCLLLIVPRSSPFYIFYLFLPFYLLKTPLVFASFFTWFLTISFILLLSNLKKTSLIIIFTTLCLIELLVFNLNELPNQTTENQISQLEESFPIILEIQEKNEKIWFFNPTTTPEIYPFQPNNNLLWQIKSFSLESSITQRYQAYLSLIYQGINYQEKDDRFNFSDSSLKLLALQSIKHLITPIEIDNLKLSTQESGLNFYRIPYPVPEKRQVENPINVQTQKELSSLLLSKQLEASMAAILEDITPPKQAVIISQSYFPGWKVKLENQKEIEVLPVNLNQQLIPLNQETREVSLYFSSLSFKKGMAFSLFTLGVCLLIFLKDHKDKKSPSSCLFF